MTESRWRQILGGDAEIVVPLGQFGWTSVAPPGPGMTAAYPGPAPCLPAGHFNRIPHANSSQHESVHTSAVVGFSGITNENDWNNVLVDMNWLTRPE
jgi:hypothetical protein